MKQIIDSYKKTGILHHAYAIFGDKVGAQEAIRLFLQKDLKFPTVANPDLWQTEFDVFKVADSRALIREHINKPVKYDKKVFLIYANSITRGAQNALLKIFEEPKQGTTFFVSLPQAVDVLPTLRSRLIIGKVDEAHLGLRAEEFLKAKIGKRLEMITRITKDLKDEKIHKADAVSFIKNIEKVVQINWKTQKGDSRRGKNILAVEDLEKAISYAHDESPSIKVILEHLALVL